MTRSLTNGDLLLALQYISILKGQIRILQVPIEVFTYLQASKCSPTYPLILEASKPSLNKNEPVLHYCEKFTLPYTQV